MNDKILLIDLTALYGRKATGIEIYGIEFYKALLKTSYIVIPIFREKNTIDDNPRAIIIKNRSRFWIENFELPKLIKRINPYCVFFPIFPPPLNCYVNNIKIIPTIHDLAFKYYSSSLSWKARLYLTPKYNRALRKSNKIITISETVANELNNIISIPVYNCNENISPSYNLSNSDFDDYILNKYKLQPGKYIISVSTLEPRKNLLYLLKIWKIISNLYPNYKLVLTGRIGWNNDNRELVDIYNQIKDKIVFTGYVSFNELINLYHYSHSFTLLSVYEGFGRPPLEALACGTRVIVSDIPVFRETLSDYNVTFVPLDDIGQAVNQFTKHLNKDINSNEKQDVTKFFDALDRTLLDNIQKLLS